MGITRVEYDRLVRKRRKCRPGDPCFTRQDDHSQANPHSPPTASDPVALPPIGKLPGYLNVPSKSFHNFQYKVSDLSGHITNMHNLITGLEDEILAGSTKGIGSHLTDARAHLTALNYYHQREQHKVDLYRLGLDELRQMYQRAVTLRANSGNPHPMSHPKNVYTDLGSKAGFIEALTEDYGYEPIHIIQAYHHRQRHAPPTPPTPTTVTNTPP